MTQTLTTSLTLSEFLRLPETKPASEYINHHQICKPIPQGKHSTIQSELVAAINSSLKSHQIARAFTELRCTFDDRSIVPDISVFQWEKIPRDENGKIANRFELAPDWVIEILSPQQNQTRVVKNIIHCLKNGTKMGWLIDPEEETVFVYEPKQEIALFDHNDTIISVPNFADSFQLKLDDLFGWLL